jgi:CHAT domain-containing protein/predicted negative regulator of RcsB-dependent stress response
MIHHAAARAFRIASAAGIIAGALLAVPSATALDDVLLKESNPRGIPLHILSEERVIDAFRSIGYVSALTSQQPLHTLFCGMLDQEAGPTLSFIEGEVARAVGLTSDAFHIPSTNEFYEKVLKDRESRRLYCRVAKRQWRCSEIIYGKKKPSRELAGMIEENIRDLESLGLGDWTGYDREVYARYWLSIDQGERAYECYRKALACYVAIGDLPLASQSANKIGRYLLRKGDWSESERFLLESLGYANEAGDPVFASRAVYGLALLRASQGYFAEAESLLVRSGDLVGAIADPTTEISELIGLAGLYCDFGEYSRAGYLVERAVLQTERNLADPAVSANKNLNFNMMQYLSEAVTIQATIRYEKREYDAAIETIRKALEIVEGTGNRRLESKLLRMLGDARAAQNRPKEASRCYADALKIARRQRDRDSEARIACALGKLQFGAGQFKKAEECFSEALDLTAGGTGWMQEAEILRLLAGAKAGARDFRAAKALYGQAIDVVQTNLAGREFESTRRASRDLVDAISTELVLLESERFRDCDSLIFAAEKMRELRSGLSALSGRDLDCAIRRCVGSRKWIPENALVIQYIVTPGRTIVIAMDGAGATYRSIPVSGEKLAKEVSAFVEAAGTAADAAGTVRDSAAALEMARALFLLLLDPISSLIEGKEVLCFVPDEALRGLPFGALVPPGAGARFLIEEKMIFASPGLLILRAGSAIRPGAERPDTLERTALIGKPEISPLLKRLYPELKSLPHAQGELAGLHRLIPHATELVGREATKDSVIAAMRRSGLVHIATHGVHYPEYGGTAALLLSSPEGGSEEENVGASLLTESEIAELDLSGTRLAVISSCESAVGKKAERVWGYGVGGAFLQAGARSVVATIRPVEDAAAKQLAAAFYAELLRERGEPLEALRRAATRIIAEDRAAGDAMRRIGVWGPYILLGSFRPRPDAAP